ncbi:MAG TPA: hypothetical protein VNN07_13910, partial [Candidatus Tectomicrobia bacterium]|nr:hypothetical protein [Candidatus Tectomicrobia bacterium]
MARAIVAHPRARDAVIVGLGLVGALSYLDGLQARGFLHGWDVYHYYVGARYFPELGYDGLYACSTAADAEDLGVEQVAPAVRNLESHRVEPGHAALRAAAQCRARFSPDRWAAFKHDVAWFRERIGPGQWRRVLRDHGFNGTPAWLVLGRTLAETGPASRAQLLALVLVDPMLLAGAGAVIARVFGWRPLCLAVGFFGLNYPARVGWTAGAFLRQDWLVATVVGVALLKRNRPVAAGAALGVAALLRIFPALVLAGLAVSAAVDAARGRTMAARTFMPRVLLGVAIAAAAVVPASFLVAGPAAWPAFARKAAVHAGTPLTNHIGLKTVVAYEHATRAEMSAPLALDADAFQPWKDARR